MRQEMLLYYIDGNIYNRDHDRQFLDSLARIGYLEWNMAAVLGGQYKTTLLGLLFLKIRGYDVPIPEIRNGRIVGRDERMRLVDWEPSVSKVPESDGEGRRSIFHFLKGKLSDRKMIDCATRK